MWSNPYMAQLVTIQRRNDAMEKERKERLLRKIQNTEPPQISRKARTLWDALLKQIAGGSQWQSTKQVMEVKTK